MAVYSLQLQRAASGTCGKDTLLRTTDLPKSGAAVVQKGCKHSQAARAHCLVQQPHPRCSPETGKLKDPLVRKQTHQELDQSNLPTIDCSCQKRQQARRLTSANGCTGAKPLTGCCCDTSLPAAQHKASI